MKYLTDCRTRFCLILLVVSFAFPALAYDDQPIETFSLKNGMEVVLIPSHRVPAVTHMLCYRVGAGDDFPGRSGLAHYNEHMMFQGTKKVPVGEFGRIVSHNGGSFNAFTTHDYTAYHVSIATDRLPLLMQLEADRMLNLAPTQANFDKEREVIIEERRMTVDNQPEGLLSEEMSAVLFRNHPYHNSVIGWAHEMKALTREDVLDFHRRFYHPANAVLVVAGDITREQLQPLAEKYYGSLPAGEKYVRNWRSEPPQRGPRHIEIHHVNVRQPELQRWYIAPSVNSEGKELVVPGFVLAQVVGGGTTSSLYQSLVVKQKIATNVATDYDGIGYGPGIFKIEATPAPGVTLPQLEAALDKEIQSAIAQDASAEDMARAKTLLKADIIYARDGMEGMARTVGALIMAGLPADYFNQWPKLVDKVSAEEVHKAALGIFDTKGSVTGYLLPEEGGK